MTPTEEDREKARSRFPDRLRHRDHIYPADGRKIEVSAPDGYAINGPSAARGFIVWQRVPLGTSHFVNS